MVKSTSDVTIPDYSDYTGHAAGISDKYDYAGNIAFYEPSSPALYVGGTCWGQMKCDTWTHNFYVDIDRYVYLTGMHGVGTTRNVCNPDADAQYNIRFGTFLINPMENVIIELRNMLILPDLNKFTPKDLTIHTGCEVTIYGSTDCHVYQHTNAIPPGIYNFKEVGLTQEAVDAIGYCLEVGAQTYNLTGDRELYINKVPANKSELEALGYTVGIIGKNIAYIAASAGATIGTLQVGIKPASESYTPAGTITLDTTISAEGTSPILQDVSVPSGTTPVYLNPICAEVDELIISNTDVDSLDIQVPINKTFQLVDAANITSIADLTGLPEFHTLETVIINDTGITDLTPDSIFGPNSSSHLPYEWKGLLTIDLSNNDLPSSVIKDWLIFVGDGPLSPYLQNAGNKSIKLCLTGNEGYPPDVENLVDAMKNHPYIEVCVEPSTSNGGFILWSSSTDIYFPYINVSMDSTPESEALIGTVGITTASDSYNYELHSPAVSASSLGDDYGPITIYPIDLIEHISNDEPYKEP